MKIDERIKELRKNNNMTQKELAEKLHVSRQAITKWENGRGLPDIVNIINISSLFDISLDDLILNDKRLSDKIISDSNSRRWHLLVILFLISLIIFIVCFFFTHRILMLGLLISTLFMLILESRIFLKDKIYLNKN